MSELGTVILHKGKEKKVRNYYPFIFKDEIGGWDPRPYPGQEVIIRDYTGALIGVGYANPKSNIAVRVLELGVEKLSNNFWQEKIRQAMAKRNHLQKTTNAYRLIHAEADGCPGLIIDKIGDFAVLQARTAGIDKVKKVIAQIIAEELHLKGVFERSDMPSREDEGLALVKGVLVGETPPSDLIVEENGVKFFADITGGHKTGYYADQRENRQLVKNWLKPTDHVLDLFCYNGGFSIFAAQNAASVLGLDLDPSAIQLANNNAKLNGYSNTQFLAEDVFAWLELAKDQPMRYDMIIIDPPAMAKKKEKADNEKWMFWRLVKGALLIIKPGGKIVVSSCAYHLSQNMLFEAIRFASGDVVKRIQIKTITFQPEDHPWMLQIPETLYLKTFFLEVE